MPKFTLTSSYKNILGINHIAKLKELLTKFLHSSVTWSLSEKKKGYIEKNVEVFEHTGTKWKRRQKTIHRGSIKRWGVKIIGPNLSNPLPFILLYCISLRLWFQWCVTTLWHFWSSVSHSFRLYMMREGALDLTQLEVF